MNHEEDDSADEEHGSFEPVYLKTDASADSVADVSDDLMPDSALNCVVDSVAVLASDLLAHSVVDNSFAELKNHPTLIELILGRSQHHW